jgi:hypothetical protein
MEVSMTDEERQQAEAYIKLQDNVNELIDERVRNELIRFITNDLQHTLGPKIANELKNNPRSELGRAIADHVRFLNMENIK